jgi:putative ABC transport system permease protein
LSSPYAIAIGNMFRKKGRLLLTQAVLVLAGGLFIIVLTLANSVTATLENELARREYDMRIVFGGIAKRADTVEEIASKYPMISAAEGWFTMSGNVLKDGELMKDSASLGTELFGVPLGSTMYEPNIVSGRWLDPAEIDNVAVISQALADFNDFELGDKFSVNMGDAGEIDLTIIGTYIAIAPDPFASDPVYIPESTLFAATKKTNRARHLLIQVDPPTEKMTAELKQALFDDFELKNIVVLQFLTRTIHEERQYANEQFAIINNLLFGLSAVMGVVGGIGLMGALSISVMERTKEIGVLRAIGAKTPVVAGMFVMEGVIQGLISWLIAVPVAYVVSRPMALALGRILLETELDFAFSWAAVAFWFVAVLVIATLASLLPARNASRISVRESLAYG